MRRFVCSLCGRDYEFAGQELHLCPVCGGSIEPVYDLEGQREHYRDVLTRKKAPGEGIWGYRDLLPVEPGLEPVSLAEGNTPLQNAENLAGELGIRRLYLKNETRNPSHAYKDRFSTIAISMAKARGCRAVALGSAGNAAASVAAYAAKGALDCFVLLPPGAVRERAWQVMSYGAKLITMEETIHDCILMAKKGEELFGWENVSTSTCFHPWAAEGYKTIGYEIGLQTGFDMPDWIFCPIGGGALMSKVYRACKDMLALGLTDKMPRFVGVQGDGCMPLVKAYEEGAREAEEWPTAPDTIAFAIADVRTFESATVLAAIKETGGLAVGVTDEEILAAMRLTGRCEAVLAEPASAVTVAALKRLLDAGIVRPGDSAACIISGGGIRDLQLFVKDIPAAPRVARNDVEGIRAAVDSYRTKVE